MPSATLFFQRLVEKVSELPGVESAGYISSLPMGSSVNQTVSRLLIIPHRLLTGGREPDVETSPGFFRALRIPLMKGRYPDEHDTQSAPWVIVINEAFARRYFPDEDPIGQLVQLRYEPYHVDEERPRQIIGIAGDVRQLGLGQPAPPLVYASYLQQPSYFPEAR